MPALGGRRADGRRADGRRATYHHLYLSRPDPPPLCARGACGGRTRGCCGWRCGGGGILTLVARTVVARTVVARPIIICICVRPRRRQHNQHTPNIFFKSYHKAHPLGDLSTPTYDHGVFDADPDGAVGEGFGLHQLHQQQPVPRAGPSAEAVRERLYEESCPARNYSQDGARRAGVLRRRD